MRDRIWVTKDGRRLRVSEMETSHIHHCIRMIQKSILKGNNWRVSYLPRLELELEIRNLPKG